MFDDHEGDERREHGGDFFERRLDLGVLLQVGGVLQVREVRSKKRGSNAGGQVTGPHAGVVAVLGQVLQQADGQLQQLVVRGRHEVQDAEGKTFLF